MAVESFTANTVCWGADGRVVARIQVSGEVDLTTRAALEHALAQAFAVTAASRIVVDLDRATFLDSSGIAVLVRARRAAARRGVTLQVVNPQATVERVLRVTGALDGLTGTASGP